MRSVLCSWLLVSAAWAQSFDVASVKVSTPEPGKPIRIGFRGGPGTDDPGRATCENCTLSNLIYVAFRTDRNHVSVPDWADRTMLNVQVTVPEGTSPEQFEVMMQNLLRERFHLGYHNEKKEATSYDLVVAKNGPKFKEAGPPAAAPAGPPPASGPPQIGADGFPVLAAGRSMIMMGGVARMHYPEETMARLATILSGQVQADVTDATGLKGKYDIGLYWSNRRLAADGADDPGPSIFDALQSQLGLRLQAKKGMIDVLVVDHIDKTPTEN